MSEGTPKKQNRIYMHTLRSNVNPAIAASIFKVYDANGTASFHYEIDRSWKSQSGEMGYSKKYYAGHADAISEVAEIADESIKVALKGGFAIGRKLTEKLSEKLTQTQQQAISVERYRVLEEEFANIKERGDSRFWQIAIEALVKVE